MMIVKKSVVISCIIMLLCFLIPAESFAASYPVSEGEYYIIAGLNCDKAVDVSGGSKADCANIQLFDFNGSSAQSFRLSYAGSGYYYLQNQGSGKFVDVAGGVAKSGTNVWQYRFNGSDSQKWKLIDSGNGFYYLQSKLGTYLDISGGKTQNGTNVQTYTANKTLSQKFQFVPTKAPVESEKYYIESALSKNKVLDIKNCSSSNKANLQLYNANNTEAQLFEITYSKGYYIIKNCSSKKVLDVAGGGNWSGNNVQQYTPNGTAAQKWYLESAGDGYYYIKSKYGLYLDVSGANTKNGTNIQVYTGNKTKAQKFRFIPYVSYSYVTKKFDCSSIDNWRKSVISTNRGLNGILVEQKVLSYKNITVQIPTGPSYNGSPYYVKKQVKLPYEVKYKLHKHTLNKGYGHSWVYRNNSIIITEQCNCGYYKEKLAWEIPDLAGPIYTQRSLIVNNRW